MSEQRPTPGSADGRDRYPGTPGWVKLIGLVALVILVLAAFILATGLGGPHGPQRHAAGAAWPGARAAVAAPW